MEDETAEDDKPQLSADALGALQQFYTERETRAQQFEDLKARAEHDFDSTSKPLSMEAFAEDWNASQFWYSDETAIALARQLLDGAGEDSRIAVVSTPSVFVQLKNLLALEGTSSKKPQITLLEFDERFAVFEEFVRYDFQQPFRLPATLKGHFDRIICDPPFLSEDCQTKAAMTVRWLSAEPESADAKLRLIVCTGERMESTVTRLYSRNGLKTTAFEVVHSKGLSNEFRCYATFECTAWKWA